MRYKFPFNEYRSEHFLFLLPLFFVLHGYMEFYDIVYLKDAVFLLLTYLTAMTVLTVLMRFLLKSWRKAALFSFFLFSFHFFFGSVHDLFKEVFGTFFITRYSFILPAALGSLILLFFLFKKANHHFNRATNFVNLLLVVFILLDLAQLAPKIYRRHMDKTAPSSASIQCDTCATPDIYLIVADEYSGYRTLKESFGFDNGFFEDQLRQRGFHIIKNSSSNYNSTPFSIASMLNMKYLKGIEGDVKNPEDTRLCFREINNNALTKIFKAKGYQIKNYSLFNVADIPIHADYSIFPTKKELITRSTFLSRLDSDIRFHLITKFRLQSEMERVLNHDLRTNRNVYLALQKEATNKHTSKPRFVYTHLMMPHYPYYFDKSGRKYPFEDLMHRTNIGENEYLGYLQYCNKHFIALIDTILKEAKKPPIILFISDHGYRNNFRPVDPTYQFMNISAIYLPNRQYTAYYNGLSNVNLFRVLLNTEFGQKLPLLPDSLIQIKQ